MLTAKDVMSKNVITVKKSLSLRDLSNKFIEHKVNGFPVVDEDGKLIGMVTENDLIEQNKNLHIPTVIALFDGVFYLESEKKFEKEVQKLSATTVNDIYNPKVITTTSDASLSQVATLMAENNTHTIPVIESGNLIGVIGKLDIIRGKAQE